MNKIHLKNVTKTFAMVTNNKDKLKTLFTSSLDTKDQFVALRNVSLDIGSGEVVGLVGINGSGKSTLANLISGIIYPNYGIVKVTGDVAIIAVSQGLKNVLSGRENIRLKCLLLGMTEEEIERRMPAIIEFADLGLFIDQPIKKYSSGMKSRLGFAIAVNVDADILIVDEALSVGDQTFYNKCIDKMTEFKNEGKTIIFVSHSLGQIKTFCDRVIWLEYGSVREDGDTQTVLANYESFLNGFKKMNKEEQTEFKNKKFLKLDEFHATGRKHDVISKPLLILNTFFYMVLIASLGWSGQQLIKGASISDILSLF